MTELKIKEKYFKAILQLQKPFEIRHKKIKNNETVKLLEINENSESTGRYIIFKSGKPEKINNIESVMYDNGHSSQILQNRATEDYLIVDQLSNKIFKKNDTWYDEFCWKYIQEQSSYIIPIKEIIEVK